MSRRVPWLTIAVLVVTGLFTTAQLFIPQLLPALRRQPSLGDGEVWRLVTAWLVHDEGLKQIAFNFPLLAIVGALAEWGFTRLTWGAAYIAAGLAGEVAGLYWQPIGAGNSVAVLGLVGLMAGRQSRWSGRPAVQRLGLPLALTALALWLVFARDIHGPALLVGLVLGQIAVRSPAMVRDHAT